MIDTIIALVVTVGSLGFIAATLESIQWQARKERRKP